MGMERVIVRGVAAEGTLCICCNSMSSDFRVSGNTLNDVASVISLASISLSNSE